LAINWARASYRRLRTPDVTRKLDAARIHPGLTRAFDSLRWVWRALPLPHSLRFRIRLAVNWARANYRKLRTPDVTRKLDAARIHPGGIVVSAYLSDVNGIGRAGRLTHDAMRCWPAKVLPHDLRKDSSGLAIAKAAPKGGIWLCHCNAPEVLHLLRHGDPRLWHNRYRIGYWAYELEQLPDSWVPAIGFFHEIWAPSLFVAKSISAVRSDASTAVRVVPHPLPDVSHVFPNREVLGTSKRFSFLAMFDTLSSEARKNPLGAVRAFQRAFNRDQTAVQMIVKIVNADKDRSTMEQLLSLVAGWPNIQIRTEHMSDQQTLQLIASVDCLVSLYRSEGFGLTVVEAMLLRTAVIATNWSAPAEFAEDAAILVPYRLVPVEDSSGRYALPGRMWAEPDLGFAAAAMRDLFEDREKVAKLVERAASLIVKRLSPGISFDGYERFLRRSWFTGW
jgi:glycosyltransferase involved in cell wall biosynthesis